MTRRPTASAAPSRRARRTAWYARSRRNAPEHLRHRADHPDLPVARAPQPAGESFDQTRARCRHGLVTAKLAAPVDGSVVACLDGAGAATAARPCGVPRLPSTAQLERLDGRHVGRRSRTPVPASTRSGRRRQRDRRERRELATHQARQAVQAAQGRRPSRARRAASSRPARSGRRRPTPAASPSPSTRSRSSRRTARRSTPRSSSADQAASASSSSSRGSTSSR